MYIVCANFTPNLKQEESSLLYSEKYMCIMIGVERMVRNDQNRRGKYMWFQSNFSRELVVLQLLRVRGLFQFIILLYFMLVSSFALS